jgi:hypothetical protein
MPGLVCTFIPACTYSAWPETHGARRLQRFQQKMHRHEPVVSTGFAVCITLGERIDTDIRITAKLGTASY